MYVVWDSHGATSRRAPKIQYPISCGWALRRTDRELTRAYRRPGRDKMARWASTGSTVGVKSRGGAWRLALWWLPSWGCRDLIRLGTVHKRDRFQTIAERRLVHARGSRRSCEFPPICQPVKQALSPRFQLLGRVSLAEDAARLNLGDWARAQQRDWNPLNLPTFCGKA